MIDLFGFSIFDSSLSKIDFNRKTIINTINPHSYCISLNDKIFKKALISSDILLPDGIGFVYAAKVLNKKKIKKISGFDLHQYLIEDANRKGEKVFYLGSSISILNIIEEKIKINFPNINISTHSPPFSSSFSSSDNIKIIKKINSFNPDYLFIGMTAPKQEKWVFENKNKLNARVISSIGAVFDFYSENIKRSNQFWIDYGLEWFPRFLKEPRRLFERNIISTPKFILQVLYLKMFKKLLFKK